MQCLYETLKTIDNDSEQTTESSKSETGACMGSQDKRHNSGECPRKTLVMASWKTAVIVRKCSG